jgi:succinoglycan biosynthesis protein ExoO
VSWPAGARTQAPGKSSAALACRVSVVVPAHNVAPWIAQAIGSVLRQTEPNLELLVVDDASTDASVAAIAAFADPRLRLLRNATTLGAARSRNRAIAEARGEWIALLDADDWWAPDRLGRLLDVAVREQADMVADDPALIEDGAVRPWSTLLAVQGLRPCGVRRVTAAEFARIDLGLTKPVIRRRFLAEHRIAFDGTLRYVHDFQCYLACLRAGARFVLVPEPLYFYRARAGALTADKAPAIDELSRFARRLLAPPGDAGPDPALAAALRERIRRADEELAYQRVAQLLKRRATLPALRELARRPGLLRFGLRRLPAVVRARLSRHARRHAGVTGVR